MSLFGSLMRDMEGDPIFGAHHRMMNQMNMMMDSMLGGVGGFGGGMGMGMGNMGMLQDPFGMEQQQRQRGHEMMPFTGPGMMSPFGPMGGMGGGFPDFNGLMRHDGGNAHSFSHMSVTSISSGPDGRPQVYQASKQTAAAPGGVRETRKAVSDTRTGTKKMSVGRHMGNRAHVREREENLFTGQREENEELVNLDEGDVQTFDRQWRERAYGAGGRYSHSASVPAITGREHHGGHGHHQQEISYPTRPSESTPSVTIEELPASDDEDQGRNTGTPMSTASAPSSSSRRTPYTRKEKEKKTKTKRGKKY